MMAKEEVAQVIAYCDENKISYKRKYAPKNDGGNAGEFLQLVPEGTFLPNPIKPSRSRSIKQKDSAQSAVVVSIEHRTPTGTMMRISGNLTRHELLRIPVMKTTGKPYKSKPTSVLVKPESTSFSLKIKSSQPITGNHTVGKANQIESTLVNIVQFSPTFANFAKLAKL